MLYVQLTSLVISEEHESLNFLPCYGGLISRLEIVIHAVHFFFFLIIFNFTDFAI